jgi:hypothetical protein
LAAGFAGFLSEADAGFTAFFSASLAGSAAFLSTLACFFAAFFAALSSFVVKAAGSADAIAETPLERPETGRSIMDTRSKLAMQQKTTRRTEVGENATFILSL